MSNVDDAVAREIIAALRTGAVPRRGLEHFATGLDPLMRAVDEDLERVAQGAGLSKWMRGEYGAGKTFATRLLCARARGKRFATSEVQISINDTPLHHLETVYRRLIERLSTEAEGVGAFAAVVDGWLYELGEQVMRLKGIDEADPAFEKAVEAKLEEKLAALSRENSAFAQVMRAYHRAINDDDFEASQGLLAWVSGQPHVASSVTRRAGVKGKVDGAAALSFLKGLLLVLRQSGHPGLVVVLDEVETIQRMPAQTRQKSLNALRQLVDMLHNDELPGLYLVVTGTPDFFDGYKGIKAEQALYQRVATSFKEGFDNYRAPQVRLHPFDADRLRTVGLRIRELFVASHPERVRDRVHETFVDRLVDHVTEGFGGRVDVTPRVFLRELVDVMDRVDLHEDYDPMVDYALAIDEAALHPAELSARKGTTPDESDEQEPQESPRRPLDG